MTEAEIQTIVPRDIVTRRSAHRIQKLTSSAIALGT